MARRIAAALMALAGATCALSSLAQSPLPFKHPVIPSGSSLSKADAGKRYSLVNPRPNVVEEAVIYMGRGQSGNPFAISAENTPMFRKNFQQAYQFCANRGAGWRLPRLDELKVVSQYPDSPDIDFLPGSYWTITPAPCFDCGRPNDYKMTYDIRTGNYQNVFTDWIFKKYPACVYDIR